MVVVDDGSTDGSRELIESYGDRVTALELPESRGQLAAINAGFAACRGAFVFLLDSDDVFLAGKVADVMDVFARHPEAGACFHRRDLLASDGITPGPAFGLSGLTDCREEVRAGRPPFIATTLSALCFRRQALEALLPAPETPAQSLGDHFLKWATLATTPVVLEPQALTLQRIHGRNRYTRNRHWRETADKQSLNALWVRRRLPGGIPLSRRLIVEASAQHLRHGESPRRSWAIQEYFAEVGRVRSASLLARSAAAVVRGGLRSLAARPEPATVPG